MKIELFNLDCVVGFIFEKHLDELGKKFFNSLGKTYRLSGRLDFDDVVRDAKNLFLFRFNRNESWSDEFYNKIPCLFVKGCEGGDIYIGLLKASYIERVSDKVNVISGEVSANLVYEDLGCRRGLFYVRRGAEDFLFYEQFRQDYAEQLAKELRSIPAGKEGFSKYEDVVKKIFDLFFDELRTTGERQKEIAKRQSRVDICYYMKPEDNAYHDVLFNKTKSSYLIVECKNSESSSELGKALQQVQTYFTETDVCNAGVIAIRKKDKLYEMKHYLNMIKNPELFLIVLDDNDLVDLIAGERPPFHWSPYGDNIVYEYSSLGKLYELHKHELLTYA